VIGGGLAGASPLFLPKLVTEMNHPFQTTAGQLLERLEITAFNLEDKTDLEKFLKPTSIEIPIPFSTKKAAYDPIKKTGVGITRLGTSNAVSIGAYAFALQKLDAK
jgi:glucokinase